MSPRLRPVLIVFAATTFACSPDRDGDASQADAAVADTSVDAPERDTADAVETDADVDADVDVDAPDAPPPEVCDDEVDNDGDGDIDCDDDDCDDHSGCPQRELCGNGFDDDGDGWADCADEDCCDTGACLRCGPPEPCDGLCTDDQLCIGGGCADPFDIDAWMPSADVSYISRIQFADNQTDETTCCFDVDGDGDIDNGFGVNLLPALAELAVDLPSLVNDAIMEGDLSLVAEYRTWSAGLWPPGVSWWAATSDLDGDNAPDASYDERGRGNGLFRIQRSSVTEHGAAIQFNRVDWPDMPFYQPPSRFTLSLPLDDLLPGFGTVTLEFANVEFEAELDAEDPRFTANIDVDGEVYGSGRLGGFIKLEQIFSHLDRVARGCTCAEFIDGTTDVVTYGEGVGYEAHCAQRSYNVDACTDAICGEYLNRLCDEWLPALSTVPLADIDSDGSGINDAVSFGLFITLVPAEIDPDQPFTDAE